MLTKWLQKWARLYSLGRRNSIDLSEDDYAIYAEALSDLMPDQLDAACLKAEQTCRFFPKPAEIRAQIDQAQSEARTLESERRWAYVMDVWIDCWFHPDLGIDRRAPKLDDRTWHAIKAAGNLQALYDCETEKLSFRKKAFIGAYENYAAVERDRNFLPESEAKRLLEQARESRNERPLLIPAAPAESRPAPESPQTVPPSTEAAARHFTVRSAPIAAELSDTEFEARKAHIRQQLKEWTARHSE